MARLLFLLATRQVARWSCKNLKKSKTVGHISSSAKYCCSNQIVTFALLADTFYLQSSYNYLIAPKKVWGTLSLGYDFLREIIFNWTKILLVWVRYKLINFILGFYWTTYKWEVDNKTQVLSSQNFYVCNFCIPILTLLF